ncbi:insulinase family protein [Puteibacter caeruleilacunae]|nr:insulinase family protein [Puteibacter caeruleilacunae]
MINFSRHKLNNGLTILVHRDDTTPMAALNIAYNVGSRDEDPNRTGFAHLFEHLMFGGSKNIPVYDEPLQRVGGDNNAYTTNDLTNYYLTLPADNLETGFWLESDRMLELDFCQKSLDVQKNVVIEEFKQRYLNQLYGDSFALLRALAYKEHPYQWPTIGKDINHIEEATLEHVKDFFFSHYAPNNAVLVASGNVNTDEVLAYAEKWFGSIPRREVTPRNLPVEPPQTEYRFQEVKKDVPLDAIYMAWHMCDRLSPEFHTTDLISDVLSNGQSSRLFRRLVIEQQLFTELDAYISGDTDAGLFIVSGKLNPEVTHIQAQQAIEKEIAIISKEPVSESELEKVKNKVEANLLYSEINYLTKAMNLANYEILGSADMINSQAQHYREVTPEKLLSVAQKIFVKSNQSVIHYHKQS